MKELQSNELNALEKAALMIRQLKDKLEQQEKRLYAPVAVVGMACRFPGNMNTPGEFWNGLLQGIDTVGLLPGNRWAVQDKNEKLYGSFIENIDAFDAAFFGISPREAKAMDPQQRLLMEASWQALEDAGIKPSTLKGTQTGVFVGAMSHDYSEWSYEEGAIDVYTGTGTSNSILAGRLSHYYDVHGPAMSIDTACSSSLVAIHQAVRSLRSGESDTCIVAGVNAILSPSLYNIEIVNQMLAPDGRCKTFDAKANGFARGEGVGVVILKRLDTAITDNDRVYCVIRGSAINHDGKSTGLMAPSQSAQEKLLVAALKDAKLAGDKIDFVECHGTGTSLGDPIEVGALQTVYGKNRATQLKLGAVKSNMGHLEGAAGIAGFMKMALSVYNAKVPPNVHFTTINPYIDNYKSIDIPVKATDWQSPIRIGGVSSFGFSGTNAHVIVESYNQNSSSINDGSYLPFVFSASSANALKEHIALFNAEEKIIGQSYTLSCRREHLSHRQLFFDAQNITISDTIKPAEWMRVPPKTVFLFSGQGSQYKDMGAVLYECHPTFKKYLDECNGIYKAITGNSLLDYIYGDKAEQLNDTSITQPAIFAVSYAVACTWRAHGVLPVALVGHSIGEWAAACFGGMLPLADAMQLVIKRGQLMESAAPGVMYAVSTSVDDIQKEVSAFDVDIAAINDPNQVVVSGKEENVLRFLQQLQGVKYRQLNVKRAFHSRLMQDAALEFEAHVNAITFTKSQCPIYNNIDGTILTSEKIKSGYWKQQILSAVNFEICAKQVPAGAVLIETGPGNTLLQLALKTNAELSEAFAGLSTSSTADAFYKSFKTVFEKGLQLDFDPFFSGKHTPVSLPPYAFQRTPYWIKEEVNTHLKRNSQLTNRVKPDSYRREWVAVEVSNIIAGNDKLSFKQFDAKGDIKQANEILLQFAALLTNCIQAKTENVVIVVALQQLEAIYRYPTGMALLACLQSVMLEQPGVFVGILLVQDNSNVDIDKLYSLFNKPDALMLQDNVFKQLKWQKADKHIEGIKIAPDKVYIIYGGSGSVGLEIAKYIAAQKGGHIILTGRRALSELSLQHRQVIDTLEQDGVSIAYQVIQHAEELESVLNSIGKKLGGVFNAAGSYSNVAVSGYTADLLKNVLSPKIDDTVALLAFSDRHSADFLLNCSSAVTMTGAPMLGHYAFANAFMDGLAEQETNMPVYSIAWGGWKGSNMLNDANNEAFQKQWGFTAVDAEAMVANFNLVSPGCTAILSIDWTIFFTTAPAAKKYQPFIAFAGNENNAVPRIANKTWSRKEVYDEVYKNVAGILQAGNDVLEYSLPFDELGFNSLLALELSTALGNVFGIELTATIVYEYTTPEQLAKYIAGLLIAEPALHHNTSPHHNNKVLIEKNIDDLSLEELKSLLDKKINN